MKALLVLSALFALSAQAQTQSPDIIISGGGVTLTVRGSGGFVCSAQDTFRKQPRLGRGVTRQEAEINARWLAAQTHGGDDFFVKTISCEGSNSGNGGISIQSDTNGLRVVVEGPSQVQCSSRNSMHNPNYLYLAAAGTQTEAFALSSNACTVGSHDEGFFCKTECVRVSQPGTLNGGVQIPGIKLPKIRIFGKQN